MTHVQLTNAIVRYEMGELDDSEIVALFQYLLITGLCWSLQGSYGRMATSLIKSGLISEVQNNE